MMKRGLLSIFVVFAGLFAGCREKMVTDNVGVNKWVHETMKEMYLWSSSLKGYVPTDIHPSQYFELLRYPGDKFSRLENNSGSSGGWSTLSASADRKNDFGFAYQLNNAKGIISYVVPQSPADYAGLNRGDIFYAVEAGERRYDLSPGSDMRECMSSGAITLCMVGPGERKVKVSKGIYYDTPVIFQKVFETTAGRTGYLVYNHFTSGENDRFLKELRSVISDFNAAGVENLILDLRYNGGGELNAAVLLASMLAPEDRLSGQFIYLERNKHEGKNYRDFEIQRFHSREDLGPSHLNLKKLCILSLEYTASASELVLHGLKPFFGNNLIHLGLATYGKNIGTSRVSNPRYLWSVNMATMRVYDINGESGYEGGIYPPHENYMGELISSPEHDYSSLGDFGEISGSTPERMLCAALDLLEHGTIYSSAIDPSPSRSGKMVQPEFPGFQFRGLTEGEIIKY